MASGDDHDVAALIDGLSHFGIGYSWGGFESLALPVDLARLRSMNQPHPGPMLRLHVGLESVEDLIADLARGLDRYD
jgi:cystathionine beta-lyase